jgi:hypothetical protein
MVSPAFPGLATEATKYNRLSVPILQPIALSSTRRFIMIMMWPPPQQQQNKKCTPHLHLKCPLLTIDLDLRLLRKTNSFGDLK